MISECFFQEPAAADTKTEPENHTQWKCYFSRGDQLFLLPSSGNRIYPGPCTTEWQAQEHPLVLSLSKTITGVCSSDMDIQYYICFLPLGSSWAKIGFESFFFPEEIYFLYSLMPGGRVSKPMLINCEYGVTI